MKTHHCVITVIILLVVALSFIGYNNKKESFINWFQVDPLQRLTDEYKAIQDYKFLRDRNMEYYPIELSMDVYNMRYRPNVVLWGGYYGTNVVGYIRRKNGDPNVYRIIYDSFRDKFFAEDNGGFMPTVEVESPSLRRNYDVSKLQKILITKGIMQGVYLFQANEHMRWR